MTLVDYFKSNGLETNIVQFGFNKQLGQGGNGFVYSFSFKEKNFAIKFINQAVIQEKLNRFKDEYFCHIQMATHENISRIYHYDNVSINGINYSIIIMKEYECNLAAYKGKTLPKESPLTEKIQLAQKVLDSMLNALEYLERYNIIHRDIKPENIFYDKDKDLFVLGDFGIAHFEEQAFPKQAENTTKSKRLANRLFSAPEQQVGDATEVNFSADIYSLAQVIYWIFEDRPLQGYSISLIKNEKSEEQIDFFNKFLRRALRREPQERFQSIKEIREFRKQVKSKLDPRKKIFDFDEIIRASLANLINPYPVGQLIHKEDVKIIDNFMRRLSKDIQPNKYWVVYEKGGDLPLEEIKTLEEENVRKQTTKWILNNEEIDISSIIFYRNRLKLYKSFAILSLRGCDPFPLSRINGEKYDGDSILEAYFDREEKRYILPQDIGSGYYYDKEGNSQKIDSDRYELRRRNFKKTAILIVLQGHASSGKLDKTPAIDLIASSIENDELTQEDIDIFLKATDNHHNPEFMYFD